MNKTLPFQDSFDSLGKALDRLEEALNTPVDQNRLVVDATIQRFEFTLELFWKNLKKFLELEGRQPKSPRETLREAYAINWLDEEEVWLAMLIDRNLTSHTYREQLADEVFSHIKNYCTKMRAVYNFLATKSAQN